MAVLRRLTSLGGTSHDWSFTLNPVYSFIQGDKVVPTSSAASATITRPLTSRLPGRQSTAIPTTAATSTEPTQTIDEYTSNAVGFNGGFGFTYRFSRFAGEKFYAEGRYVYTDNSPRPFSLGSSTSNYFNVFPQNSAKTTYIPITFGIRF